MANTTERTWLQLAERGRAWLPWAVRSPFQKLLYALQGSFRSLSCCGGEAFAFHGIPLVVAAQILPES